jgi:hypothetical protein
MLNAIVQLRDFAAKVITSLGVNTIVQAETSRIPMNARGKNPTVQAALEGPFMQLRRTTHRLIGKMQVLWPINVHLLNASMQELLFYWPKHLHLSVGMCSPVNYCT